MLREQDAWDSHTRSIVLKRVRQPSTSSFNAFNRSEVAILRSVVSHLLYEDRDELIDFVVAHIDKKVAEKIGESQRKRDVPAEEKLIRSGLKALNDAAKTRFAAPFLECDAKQQFLLIRDLQQGNLGDVGPMKDLPQKELFKKLLGLTTEAYASHPTVWSEMGYAGPAYPRGYYRIEQGLLDPWEPPHNGSEPERNGSVEKT